MVDYLRAVAAGQEGNIFYQHNVADIVRNKEEDGSNTFDVLIDVPGQRQIKWKCRIVIGAPGLGQPNVPTKNWVRGLDLAVGYEELYGNSWKPIVAKVPNFLNVFMPFHAYSWMGTPNRIFVLSELFVARAT